MPRQSNNSNMEIPPGAVSAANPEAGAILQLSPEEELKVNQYAQQRGITQGEAVRQLLDYSDRWVEQENAPTVIDKTLGVVQQAKEMGVVSSDPNDVVNSMARGVVVKSLAKGLEGDDGKKGGVSMSDLKEMYYLRIMGGMAGINDNSGGGTPDVIKRLEAQNEKFMQELKDRDEKHEQRIKEMEDKQREKEEKSEIDKRFEKLEQAQKDQFDKLMQKLDGGGQANKSSEVDKLIQEMREKDTKHKEEMDKMKSDIRDMVFEKKIEDLEKNQITKDESYKQDIKTLNEKIDLVGRIPATTAPTKDGLSELEEIGGKLERIKKAMEPIFPHVNAPAASGSALPPIPATPLKNPDGSTDYIAAAERLGTIVVKGLEAINKEKPPKANIAGTNATQTGQQPAYTEKRMSPEEYANYLLSMPTRTAEQNQWLTNYKAYLEKEYAKLAPAAPQQPGSQQPVPSGCSICGNPVYQDGWCGKCWADINVPKEEPVQQAPVEPSVLTWEQAEELYAQLLQKPSLSNEEAAWVDIYEKKKREMLARQQPYQAAAVPVKEYTPPAEAVQVTQPVLSEPALQDVQQEAAAVATPVEAVTPEPVPQEPVEQLHEPQEVQAEVQTAAEPQTDQPQEETSVEDTVTRLREEEEARARAMKGFL